MSFTNQDYIASLYVSMYNRAPDFEGLNFWLQVAEDSGLDGLALMTLMAEGFAEHPSFLQLYGGLGNAAFVDALYENVGGNEGDDSGKQYWVDLLNAGTSRADVAASFTFGVLTSELTPENFPDLTPEELAAAQQRQDQLQNKVEVALTYTTVMGESSNLSPTTDPFDLDSLLQDPAYLAAIAIIDGVDANPASKAEELAYLGGTPTIEGINELFGPEPAGDLFILTTEQDFLPGGPGDDIYLATQDTLQTGDVLLGDGGNDVLLLSADSNHFSAPTLESIEAIHLNAPNVLNPQILVDLSNSDGVNAIYSYQVSKLLFAGGLVGFADIQDVNATDIGIRDTRVDHVFTYDTNAYLPDVGPSAGRNVVDLSLQEVKGSSVVFGNESPFSPSQSFVDEVNLVSLWRDQNSNAYVNTLSELSVGDDLDVLTITGEPNDAWVRDLPNELVGPADLRIVAPLDRNIRLIDASALVADLSLVVDHTDATRKPALFEYKGAQDDRDAPQGTIEDPTDAPEGFFNDQLDVTRNGNGRYELNSGNDLLEIDGDGNQSIVAGPQTLLEGETDDDFVLITGDGEHNIVLGAGNDFLSIVGDVIDYDAGAAEAAAVVYGTTTITGDAGNDIVSIVGNGNYDIDLGAGNDFLFALGNGNYFVDGGDGDDDILLAGDGNRTIFAGDGNDLVDIVGTGNDFVDAGAGDDVVNIVGQGEKFVVLGAGNDSAYLFHAGIYNSTVLGGDGNDTVLVEGDGNVTATGDAGNDRITIIGTGVHGVDLGSGNDFLLIDGARTSADNVENAGNAIPTTIVGGTGNDTVQVTQDHFLDADLGAGNDQITLRAKDLTSQDTVAGGDGTDTMILTNVSNSEIEGLVRLSETRNTSSFEVFDLRDSNIELHLTDNLFDTANGPITVLTPGVAEPLPEPDADEEGEQSLPMLGRAPTTVDLSAVSNYGFEQFNLDGGDWRDIVVVTDEQVNSNLLSLSFGDANNVIDPFFDDSLGEGVGSQDTLRVLNGAEITAADLVNVTGLERIELVSESFAPQVWSIELTDNVINQTTDVDSLIIHVAPNVPAGSRLYVTLDPSVVGATNNVVIEKNANVSVYINGDIVSEPELGTDFNPGAQSITVVNQLIFTSRGDNLQGTPYADLFIANSLDDMIGPGDTANGGPLFGDPNDTLLMNFAVNNDGATLEEIFLGADITNIDNLVFHTENNVVFNGVGLGYLTSLKTVSTGLGDDELTSIRKGLAYSLSDGDDFLRLQGLDPILPLFGPKTTVDGGAGTDTVIGDLVLTDWIGVQGVEYIDLRGGEETVDGDSGPEIVSGDRVDLLVANPDLVEVYNAEAVIGSDGDDNVYADNDGSLIYVDGGTGNDTLDVGTATPFGASVYGGFGDDDLYVRATRFAIVEGNQGNDYIEVDVEGPYDPQGCCPPNASVDGGEGNDTIDVVVIATEPPSNGIQPAVNGSGPQFARVFGDAGNDDIYVRVEGFGLVDRPSGDIDSSGVVSDPWVLVYGGSGNDTIDVIATVAFGPASDGEENADDLMLGSSAQVYGQDGADDITVTADYITVDGGNGNDTIDATGDCLTVLGGSGNDSIDVDVDSGGSIEGGLGNDSIDVFTSAPGPVIVDGRAGDDWISVSGSSGAASDIYAGPGDDLIQLQAAGVTQVEDYLYFGNIAYNAPQQQSSNTQGTDTIVDFVFEEFTTGGDPLPQPEDCMDFSEFLDGTADNLVTNPGTYQNGDTVVANAAAGNAIVVLSSNGAQLTAADFSVALSGIQLNNNSQAVVVVGQDQTGAGSGISNFDIYYVQDSDSGLGQNWEVDLVASVASATSVGVESVIDNLTCGLIEDTGVAELSLVGVNAAETEMSGTSLV